jgi:hypothetical protein
MNVTKKLLAAFSSMSMATLGLGLAATGWSSSLENAAIIAASTLALAVIFAFAFGAPIDRKLGASPEELRRKAAELASGYLAPLEEGSEEQGAAAELSLATAQLNTTFRAARDAARELTAASYKIVSLAMLESGSEAEKRSRLREIEARAQELAATGRELEAAIGFYSFAPKAQSVERELLAASAERRLKEQGVRKPSEKPQPRQRPSRGHKPHLRLLPRVEREASAKARSASRVPLSSGSAGLRLIDPTEDTKE